MRILAGDIGGTNTRLLLRDGRRTVHQATFESKRFTNLSEAINLFLDGRRPPRFACFGIAGPVIAGRCVATNLPWVVEEKGVERRTGIAHVRLVNDLVAIAYGALIARSSTMRPLWGRAKPPVRAGNVAVLAPGTGLGEAAAVWDRGHFHPLATEGSHVDFAPRDALEDELRSFIQGRLGGAHVSYERILSGPGIGVLYDFFVERGTKDTARSAHAIKRATDRNAAITELGLNGHSKPARLALELFASIYGAEAGNFALKTLAAGGVLLCGNITHRIRSVLERGGFRESFLDKGRLGRFLEQVPVATVGHEPGAPDLGLAGSIYLACEMGER